MSTARGARKPASASVKNVPGMCTPSSGEVWFVPVELRSGHRHERATLDCTTASPMIWPSLLWTTLSWLSKGMPRSCTVAALSLTRVQLSTPLRGVRSGSNRRQHAISRNSGSSLGFSDRVVPDRLPAHCCRGHDCSCHYEGERHAGANLAQLISWLTSQEQHGCAPRRGVLPTPLCSSYSRGTPIVSAAR